MLKEFLTEIVGLAHKSRDPKLLPMPPGADPALAQLFNPTDGCVTQITIYPPDRKHKVFTLDSLRLAHMQYSGVDSTIWCAMSQIVLVLFDGDASFRRNTVTMALQPSPLFQSLRSRNGNEMDQEELVKFLRHDMSQATITPEQFTKAIQSLKFSQSQEISGQVTGVSKSTFGKSTMAEVTGAAELPEQVTFSFEPWPNSRIWPKGMSPLVSITCSVFTDASEGTITLTALPGEFEAAEAAALDELCDRVAEGVGIDRGRVFAGTVA